MVVNASVKLVLGLSMFALHAAASAQASDRPAIHVRSVGAGEACWILLHPFGASGRFWEQRAARIATERSVRVYFPDLPSHGASRMATRFDYAEAAAAVAAALRSECPAPEVIVGASSGGIVAMKLGAASRSRVVAIGVGRSFSPDNIRQMARNAEAESTRPDPWLSAFSEQGDVQMATLRGHFRDLADMGTAAFLSPGEARALRGRLLLLWGERDDFFDAQSVRSLVDEIAGTRIETFPGAGHLEPLAQANAERTWTLVFEFADDGRQH